MEHQHLARYQDERRPLWNREDAEDATQEILVRVVTRLAQFDFRSRLKTWVYRVAVNYILDVKKSPVERMHLTFERFADDLADGLSSDGPMDTERSLLTEEVKIGCTRLASDTAACACHRRGPVALRVGRIREEAIDFAGEAPSYRETRSYVRRVEEARWALEVHRSSQPRASSVDFARRLADALDSKA